MSAPRKTFESRVQAGAPDECWPWLGGYFANGYGSIHVPEDKHMRLAHRRAWELANGPVSKGLHVCHRCDNRGCCNPAHLFLGSSADNTADRHDKSRDARGSKHGMAKLTEADVIEIRRLRADGRTTTSLAAEFGVTQSMVSAIALRRNWQHV